MSIFDRFKKDSKSEAVRNIENVIEAGRKTREQVAELKKEGKSETEIAKITGLQVTDVRTLSAASIRESETLWFPGEYSGRTDAKYRQFVGDVTINEIIALVQKRAQEDGEWLIANGFVGENNANEPKMRRMMAWVSDETNIRQCVAYIVDEERLENTRTVDFVCRDLANGSKVAGLGRPNDWLDKTR